MDTAIAITADDCRLQISQPQIHEGGIGSVRVRLDHVGGSFDIDDCELWLNTDFADQLQVLYDSLVGSARFDTLAQDLKIDLEGIGDGHIKLKIDMHRRGMHDHVAVSVSTKIDQSYLPAIIIAWRRYFVT